MRRDLIIDVGMHTGEDTAFYLAKGFDVVAIEANPSLVAAARERFAGEISQGRLDIRGVAITQEDGTTQIGLADEVTIWSSLSPQFIERNETVGTRYRYVEVPACRFETILSEVGIPYYLKVDIEGLDMLCIRALHHFDTRPQFVSMESTLNIGAPAEALLSELAHLWALGYRSFKFIDQSAHPTLRCPYPAREGQFVDAHFTMEGSGPFGAETPGAWRGAPAALFQAELLRRQHSFAGWGSPRSRSLRAYRGLRRAVLRRDLGWYDLHAQLGP